MFLGFALNLLGVAYDECSFIIFYKLFRSRELYTLPTTSSYKNSIRNANFSSINGALRPVAFHWNKARKKKKLCANIVRKTEKTSIFD
jgi:endonuclease III